MKEILFSCVIIFGVLYMAHAQSDIEVQINFVSGEFLTGAEEALDIAVKQIELPYYCPYSDYDVMHNTSIPDCYHHLNNILHLKHKNVKYKFRFDQDQIENSAAIIGAYASVDSVQISNNISTPLQIPMISYGSTDVQLSSQELFPFFSRVIGSNDHQASAIVDMMFRIGWISDIAILSTSDDYGISGKESLKQEASKYNLKVNFDMVVENNYTEVFNHLKTTNTRYILCFLLSNMIKDFLLSAKQNQMLDGDFIFIFSEDFGSLLHLKDETAQFYDGQDNELLPGLLFVQASTGFWKKDEFLLHQWEEMHPNLDIPYIIPYIYDSFLAIAFAIDTLLDTHEAFAIQNGTLLLENIRKQDFLGSTGRVIFNSNGDRTSSSYILTNIREAYQTKDMIRWEVGRVFKVKVKEITIPGGSILPLNVNEDRVEIIGSAEQFFAIPDSASPPPIRCSASTSLYPPESELIVFGGRIHVEKLYSDFWKYDLKIGVWKQIFSFKSPSARSEHASFVWRSMDKEFYYSIFGGYNGQALLQEQWNYKFTQNTWFESTNIPVPARMRARTTSLQKNTYLVAGEGITHEKNDIWIFNHETEKWTEEEIQNPEELVPRKDHCLTIYRRQLIVWAGRNADNEDGMNDFLLFNLTSKVWTKILPIGDFPIPRYSTICETYKNHFYGGLGYSFHPLSPEHPYDDFYKMNLDPQDGIYRFEKISFQSDGWEGRDHVEWVLFEQNIVFNAGWGKDFLLNDLIRFSMRDNSLVVVHPSQITPPNTYYHESGLVGNEMYVFGGNILDGEVRYSNDLIKLNLESFVWVPVYPKGKLPEPSSGSASVVYRDLIYIHGGLSASGYLSDMWEYSTQENKWTFIEFESTENVPTARAYHTGHMYENNNSGIRSIYFFGGVIKNMALEDIWEYDIDKFQFHECIPKASGTSPPKSVSHLQSASFNNTIILYSGEDRSVSPLDYVYTFSPESKRWGIFATIPKDWRTSRSQLIASDRAIFIHGGSYYDKMSDILLEVRPGFVRRIPIEDSLYRPEKRGGHTMLLFGSRLLIFGGNGALPSKKLHSGITVYNNLYEYRIGSLCMTVDSLLIDDGHCIKCGPGTYHDLNRCLSCNRGYYNDKWGATKCDPCPPGFYGSMRGASSQKLCLPCKANTWQDEYGASSCKPCNSDTEYCPLASTRKFPNSVEKSRDGTYLVSSGHPNPNPERTGEADTSKIITIATVSSICGLWLIFFLLTWYWIRHCLHVFDICFNEKHNYRIGNMKRKKTVTGGFFTFLFVIVWIGVAFALIYPFSIDNVRDIKTLTPTLTNSNSISMLMTTLVYGGPPDLQCTEFPSNSWSTCHKSLKYRELDYVYNEKAYNAKTKKMECLRGMDEDNHPTCSIRFTYFDFYIKSSVASLVLEVNEEGTYASNFEWNVTSTSGYLSSDGNKNTLSIATGKKYSSRETVFRGKQIASKIGIKLINTIFKDNNKFSNGAHVENLYFGNGSFVGSSSFTSRNGFQLSFVFEVAENFYQIERSGKKEILQLFGELGGATGLIFTITIIIMRAYESVQSLILHSPLVERSEFLQKLLRYRKISDPLEFVDKIKRKADKGKKKKMLQHAVSLGKDLHELTDLNELFLLKEDHEENE